MKLARRPLCYGNHPSLAVQYLGASWFLTADNPSR